jgi:hypothetical protein
MTLTNDTHDMSPPAHVPHGAPSSAVAADIASIRKQAKRLPATTRRAARGPAAVLISLVARRDRYVKTLEQLEEPITDAVHAARVDGASWDAIGHILGVHKDTARRNYQDSSIEAGGPEPRVKRCGMQQATPAGWCRNGVAGSVAFAGGGPALDICRAHGEEGVASGKYVWRVKPEPLPPGAQQ